MQKREANTPETADARLATAFRRAAVRLEKEWDQGRRASNVNVWDVRRLLEGIADEVDPPKKRRRTR